MLYSVVEFIWRFVMNENETIISKEKPLLQETKMKKFWIIATLRKSVVLAGHCSSFFLLYWHY